MIPEGKYRATMALFKQLLDEMPMSDALYVLSRLSLQVNQRVDLEMVERRTSQRQAEALPANVVPLHRKARP